MSKGVWYINRIKFQKQDKMLWHLKIESSTSNVASRPLFHIACWLICAFKLNITLYIQNVINLPIHLDSLKVWDNFRGLLNWTGLNCKQQGRSSYHLVGHIALIAGSSLLNNLPYLRIIHQNLEGRNQANRQLENMIIPSMEPSQLWVFHCRPNVGKAWMIMMMMIFNIFSMISYLILNIINNKLVGAYFFPLEVN